MAAMTSAETKSVEVIGLKSADCTKMLDNPVQMCRVAL
jgi:hypothetical protein